MVDIVSFSNLAMRSGTLAEPADVSIQITDGAALSGVTIAWIALSIKNGGLNSEWAPEITPGLTEDRGEWSKGVISGALR